jgi:hypothetical protein
MATLEDCLEYNLKGCLGGYIDIILFLSAASV